MAVKILVLRGACCARSNTVLNAVAASLKRLKRNDIKYLEVDFSSFSYWDSPSTILISPAPILDIHQGYVKVLPEAFIGKVADAELDQILVNCFDKVH